MKSGVKKKSTEIVERLSSRTSWRRTVSEARGFRGRERRISEIGDDY
jgi:hypothetical protein